MSGTHDEFESSATLPHVADDSVDSPAILKWLGIAVVNLWLCYHLFAIVVCPASVAPAMPIAQSGWTLVSGYLQLLYLNHGFHFFAPDPAGSSLVRCQLEFANHTTRSVQYPNKTIWPRLLYHRHFMVTEFLGNGPVEERPYVERAIARQLCRTFGAERATLYLVYHDTASVADILTGKTLNEPASFTEQNLGTFFAQELASPYQPPTEAPAATMLSENSETGTTTAKISLEDNSAAPITTELIKVPTNE